MIVAVCVSPNKSVLPAVRFSVSAAAILTAMLVFESYAINCCLANKANLLDTTSISNSYSRLLEDESQESREIREYRKQQKEIAQRKNRKGILHAANRESVMK